VSGGSGARARAGVHCLSNPVGAGLLIPREACAQVSDTDSYYDDDTYDSY
jgi:hypothetical protein